jgi:drug/metabolite transporter (DMT)-like permease
MRPLFLVVLGSGFGGGARYLFRGLVDPEIRGRLPVRDDRDQCNRLSLCVSFWIFLFCLERGGAATVVTLRNTSVLFAQGFSWWLGEGSSALQIGGAMAIAAGAFFLAA